ncbi:hypothetical protein [Changchengzhania lutea]|uniref:hypothetical protein n=1 Tax=Changchengzhania lutea TaxID=2049305 RepID=UPI00115E0C1E|nr:hypothetical protein [Changchengzhania lutea]
MKKIVLFLGVFVSMMFGHAQEPSGKKSNYLGHVQTIDSTIETLYKVISGEKGEARQWELFKFLFKPGAKLIPSGKNTKGDYQVRYMKPEDYIKGSGDWLVENGFFEKELSRTVNAYGNIAHVFSTYESFKSEADEKPFMRGINSIQLFHDGTRWWVINIYWANETKDNPIPKKYLP